MCLTQERLPESKKRYFIIISCFIGSYCPHIEFDDFEKEDTSDHLTILEPVGIRCTQHSNLTVLVLMPLSILFLHLTFSVCNTTENTLSSLYADLLAYFALLNQHC